MDVRERVGLNLQRLRREKGLSQEELADLADIHQTYLSGVERGKRNPTITVLQRIAEALGADIQDLVKKRGWRANTYRELGAGRCRRVGTHWATREADKPYFTALGQSRRPQRQSALASGEMMRSVQDRLRQSTYIYDPVVGDFVDKTTSPCPMYLI